MANSPMAKGLLNQPFDRGSNPGFGDRHATKLFCLHLLTYKCYFLCRSLARWPVYRLRESSVKAPVIECLWWFSSFSSANATKHACPFRAAS
eukprot:scaffold88492_cov60-Phaeocystis_antarctica.AAC.1